MLVLVKALRPTVAGGGHHEPGANFFLEEVDAVSLESRGIVERVHVKKTAPPENKMAEPAENKAVEKPKPKARLTRRRRKK